MILVANEKAKEKIPEELGLALVLTVYEAKGLEFDDVLLYNFFTDSEVRHTGFFSHSPGLCLDFCSVEDSLELRLRVCYRCLCLLWSILHLGRGLGVDGVGLETSSELLWATFPCTHPWLSYIHVF